ncbi:GAF domain-containing sensor histidine kinase [Anaerolinea thermophila]|uniref:Two-component sensor histidine kinase n=1 Tax=Anaerolinea thermophila (strain DSM 14523 / JCM 11388 / NBRC 100420 / UNI-1) TaxID=926569 RepID=E8N0Q2_ANATU|nr:GAF domain-containing sensor histidine kinase [Anaerolinea thermophila]BAJ62447.1 putative two-component sensor histidine kinase [Anaerolinea thermophila UNI-1]
MKRADFPYLADWFAITFRWMAIVALAFSLILYMDGQWLPLALLAGSLVWNLTMTVLAVFNQRLPAHRTLNTLVDLAISMTLFGLTGSATTPIQWVGVLAIAPSAMYFELRGALLIAVMATALETGILYFLFPAQFNLLVVEYLGGLNLAIGLVFGGLSLPLMKRVRTTYHELVRKQHESETAIQRRERERLQAFFDMIETFSSTFNYKRVLEVGIQAGIKAMGLSEAEGARLLAAFFLFEDHTLRYVVGQGFPQRDQNLPLAAQEGILRKALQSGEPQIHHGACDDPELSELVALHTCQSLLIIPLLRGMNVYGILLFAHPDQNFFPPERVEYLMIVGHQAVIAIQNARLFADLQEEKERIVQTQEEAQRKLARDLHDGPTQSVSSIAMRLNIARRLLHQNPTAAEEELAKIEELARRTTQEIRHMLFTLRPLVLESEGLEAALKAMAEKMRDLYQQNVVLDVDPTAVSALDSTQQTVVFYLCEEAVNNARKHAEASQITVRLKYVTNYTDIIGLEISDNGKGFNVNEVMGSYERRGSLGMINLRERADLVNGLLRVDSAPGKGTRIRVFIPLTEEAMDRLHGRVRA